MLCISKLLKRLNKLGFKATRNFCENNSSDTILTQYFGKTGLAKIVQFSEKGSLANPLVIKDRSLFLKLIMIIKRRFKNLFRVR